MAPSAVQILIIILIVMVLFGAGRIPNIMENMAKGINSFKKGLKDEDDSPKSLEDKGHDAEDIVVSERKDESKDV
jgi:sec-independent protein translocase protein TatA